jgi:hypothetical protein
VSIFKALKVDYKLIKHSGIWGIGLGTRKCQLNTTVRKDGWLLSEDGSFWADGKLIGKLQQPIGEGDTIVSLFKFTTGAGMY